MVELVNFLIFAILLILECNILELQVPMFIYTKCKTHSFPNFILKKMKKERQPRWGISDLHETQHFFISHTPILVI